MNNIDNKNENKGFNINETKGFDETIISYFTPGKHRQRIRIFKPWEVKAVVKVIPKDDYRTMFETLLYTGMRYEEAKILKDNSEMFEGEKIHLTPIAIKKAKIMIKERWITLTPLARKVVSDYLKVKKSLPHWNTWRENLVRWSNIAKIDSRYLSVKTTRKTWESWLATYYPNKLDIIYLNQGHTSAVALKHYLNLPFNQKDKQEMFEFVAGWEP